MLCCDALGGLTLVHNGVLQRGLFILMLTTHLDVDDYHGSSANTIMNNAVERTPMEIIGSE
jgi:hypothetical protein